MEPPPDDLICKICHLPASDPQQTNVCCGQIFCAICLDRYTKSTILDNNQCPYCKTEPFVFMADARTRRNVRNLKVFCPNKSLGCTWTDELRSLDLHLVKDCDNKKGCPFTELQCSNGCGVVMQRRLVEGHLKSECELREVKCEYCNTTGSYQWINSSHCEECPKYPVECPNHCEVGHVRREEISRHFEQCPLAIVKCLFGCKETVRRGSMMAHMREAITVHMEHILKCVERFEKAIEYLEDEISKIRTELRNNNCTIKDDLDIVTVNVNVTMNQVETIKQHLANQETTLGSLLKDVQALQWRIVDVERNQELSTQRNEELESKIQSVQENTNEEVCKRAKEVETKLEANLNRVTNELADTKQMTSNGFTAIKQRYDALVAEKKAEIEKLNEELQKQQKELQACNERYEKRLQGAENELRQVNEREERFKQQLQAAEVKFKNQLQEREVQLRQQFTTEMQEYRDNFNVLLNLQSWDVQLNYLHKTCNNILPNVYVKITEFVVRSRDSWSSQPFYTSDKGYKMCISVSSSNNNNYVSVRALLMSGEYDNYLQWPIKGTLKLQLLNQCYDGNHNDPVDIVFNGAEDNPCCQRVLVGNKSHYGIPFDTFISNKFLAEDVKKRQHYCKNNTLYFKILKFDNL